jgi:hypothetical protein
MILSFISIYRELSPIVYCWSGLVYISKKVCNNIKSRFPCPFENKFVWYIQTENDNFIEFYPHNLLWWKYKFKTKKWWWFILQWRQLSEDLLFFERCKNFWFQIYCDTHLKCLHFWEETINV